MNGLRKGLVFVLVPLLFVALLGTAVSISANLNLKDPAKIEGWLKQSKIYDNFISNAAKVSQNQEGDSQSNGSVSLSDTAVQNAAESAFSSGQIEQYVKTFIDSNYAWLQGNTDKPTYNIDLKEAKQTFAQKVGQYVTAYSKNLPVCTPNQEAQAQASDPLNATCRPAGATPEQIGATVTKDLENGSFLNNPVITADSINNGKQPYYKKLSHLPQLYQIETYAPYVFGALSLIFITSIIFLSSTRRGGFKKTAWTLTFAGVGLVFAKFSADYAYNHLIPRAFNNAAVGDLQKGLTSFGRLVQSSVSQTEMYIGLGYLAVALIIFVVILVTRSKKAESKEVNQAPPAAKAAPAQQQPPTSRSNFKSANDPTGASSPATTAPTLPKATPSSAPKKPKRPRLIQ